MGNNHKEAARKRVAKELEINPNYYRDLGSQGGRARVSKGFASLTTEERKAISIKGQEARAAKRQARDESSNELHQNEA